MKSKPEMRKLLLRVYKKYGPRHGPSGIVRPSEYAKMTKEYVNYTWDFADRKLMHDIARAVVAAPRKRS